MYYIGIDLGTSAVKLLLMEGNGKIVRVTSREYPLYFPHPGWSQQNPEDWYKQSMDGLCELLDGIDKSQVAGISFGGQMHGLVVLDENDQVIRPAILWNDGRTFRENDYLNQVIGKEKLSEYTANISFTGELCTDQKDHAAEGLPGISSDRRTLHGCIGRFRHAVIRCEEPLLVGRNV